MELRRLSVLRDVKQATLRSCIAFASRAPIAWNVTSVRLVDAKKAHFYEETYDDERTERPVNQGQNPGQQNQPRTGPQAERQQRQTGQHDQENGAAQAWCPTPNSPQKAARNSGSLGNLSSSAISSMRSIQRRRCYSVSWRPMWRATIFFCTVRRPWARGSQLPYPRQREEAADQ
jgi:hypothetical protein